MKRITALLLVLVMLAGMVGCGNRGISGLPGGNFPGLGGNTGNQDTDTPSADVPSTDTPSASEPSGVPTRGSIDGDVYTNEYLGFAFTKPASWDYATDAELWDEVETSAEFVGIDIEKNVKDYGIAYDAMADDEITGSSLVFAYENVESMYGHDMTEKEYADVLGEELETLTDFYFSVSDSYETVKLGNTNFLRVYATAEYMGTTITQAYYLHKVGDYMAGVIVSLSSMADYTLADVEAMFTKISSKPVSGGNETTEPSGGSSAGGNTSGGNVSGGNETTEPSGGSTVGGDTPKATLTRGTLQGNIYVNDYVGFEFSKPAGWVYATDEELLAAVNIGSEKMGVDITTMLETNAAIYDMMVSDPYSGASLMVGYENLALTGGLLCTEKQYMEAVERQFPNTADISATFSGTYETVKIGDTDFVKSTIYATYYGVSQTQTYYLHKTDKYMVFLIVTIRPGYTQQTPEEIEDMFCAIGGTPAFDYDQAPAGGEEESKNTMTRGSISGNVYKNDYLGFKFVKPTTWQYASDEDLFALLEAGAELMGVTTNIELILENNFAVYDMMTDDPYTGSNVSVCYENLLLTYGKALSEQEYAELIRQELENSPEVTFTLSDELETFELGGIRYTKVCGTANYYGVTLTQAYYMHKIDNYMAFIVITLSSNANYTLADIESMFY